MCVCTHAWHLQSKEESEASAGIWNWRSRPFTVACPMWKLKTKPRSSARASRVLNHWVIPLVLGFGFLDTKFHRECCVLLWYHIMKQMNATCPIFNDSSTQELYSALSTVRFPIKGQISPSSCFYPGVYIITATGKETQTDGEFQVKQETLSRKIKWRIEENIPISTLGTCTATQKFKN